MFFNLLSLPQIVTDTFTGLQVAFVVLIAVFGIIMIIAVLASPPQSGIGNNAITGASESYYTKNKGKNNQGRIKWLIISCAIIISVCAILYFVTYSIYQGQ